MSWTFCLSGAAVAKAGSYVSDVIQADSTAMDNFSDQAEGRIVAETRKNYLSEYATLDAEVVSLLNDIASSLIAIQLVNYDMGVYTNLAEAQTILNVQDDKAQQGIRILKDWKTAQSV